MKKQINNEDWFYFFSNLMTHNFLIKGGVIPKYILYYKGYNSEKLLTGVYKNIKIESR